MRPLTWALLCGLVAAGPAAGDWLITREGERIETRGPWTEKGRMIVFTLPNGTLSSIRASEIDLEASRTATAEAQAPPSEERAAEPAAKKPLFVLTDRDVRRVPTTPRPEDAEDEEAGPAPVEGGVEVVSWKELEGGDPGVQIFGTLRNRGREVVSGVAVTVSLLDEAGQVLDSSDAAVNDRVVGPAGLTNFRVSFPNVLHYAQVRFEVSGQGFEVRRPGTPVQTPAAPPAEAEPEGEGEGGRPAP